MRKQALVRFELQDNPNNYLRAVSGIVFFATPHITTCADETSQELASLLRYQHASLYEGLFIENDLTSLAWSSLKFAELKLHCPILSCYEHTSIKLGHDILGRPWSALAVTDFIYPLNCPNLLTLLCSLWTSPLRELPYSMESL